jgi:ubiquinone/menaquinone biosynthesis C-methylase UbiE
VAGSHRPELASDDGNDDALGWAMKETTLTETERVRRIQDKEAPRYDRHMGFFDRILFAGGREWACSQVNGAVLEVAVGTGRNLPYYLADVRLTGIELSPRMLEIGRRRAGELGRDVDLRIGDAQALEFEDQSFDTVIITFGLCTIPDDRAAVTEAHRVLRPGGRLVLLEHVRSPSLTVRAVQRVLDPLSVRFAADHLVRDPLDYLGNVGFEIESMERLKWGIVERVVARKSGGEAGSAAAGT